MAASHPSRGQPKPFHGAMRANRPDGVCTTARSEAATLPKKRADEPAITLDHDNEQPRKHGGPVALHRESPCVSTLAEARKQRVRAASRSAANCSAVAPAASGSARTTSRLPAGSMARRAATRWRNWRRIRLRTTAPPTVRDTTNPARAAMPPVSANARWTTRRGRDARRPSRIVALKSGRRRSRDAAGSTGIAFPGGVRPTGPDGPFGGEQRGWLGRHVCACAAGNRGSLRGGDCSAGTCACSLEGSRKETVRRINGGERLCAQGFPSYGVGTSRSQEPPTVRADRRHGQTRTHAARVECATRSNSSTWLWRTP